MRNIIKMPLDREKRKQYLKQFYLKNKRRKNTIPKRMEIKK
jgi:hypothetical protein